MIKTVLFDLDGTLADTELVMMQTMLFFVEKYRPGLKVSFSDLSKTYGPPLVDTLKSYFPYQDPETLAKEFSTQARVFYPKYAKAFDGALEIVNRLVSEGYDVGLVTTKHRINALFTLEVCGFPTDLFMISFNEVKNPKPDPEGLFLAMEHFQSNAKETLFIGDTIYDYLAGVNAKVHTGLVAWSSKSFEDSVKPSLWVKSFDDILTYIHGHR
jgi:pyrophosphatase PpaX